MFYKSGQKVMVCLDGIPTLKGWVRATIHGPGEWDSKFRMKYRVRLDVPLYDAGETCMDFAVDNIRMT